jgi:hypothetical protein
MHKRMQKHLCAPAALHGPVWAALVAYLQGLLAHVQDVAHRCYDMSSVDPLPAPRDVAVMAAAVRP